MRHLTTLVVSALLLGSWSGHARAQVTITQGKESVFAETYVFDLDPPGSSPVISVRIPHAKARRVLLIDATMVSNEFGPVEISTAPLVNGNMLLPLWPNGGVVGNCSAGEFACTAAGHWWLDLDAAEAQSPGTVLNKPLTIDLYANEGTGFGAAEVSLRAWMMKK